MGISNCLLFVEVVNASALNPKNIRSLYFSRAYKEQAASFKEPVLLNGFFSVKKAYKYDSSAPKYRTWVTKIEFSALNENDE